MAKYNSIENIQARLFFEILETKDFTKLELEEGEDGERIFTAIYDDYFIKSDNKEANQYLKLTKEITLLAYKIETIKQICKHLAYDDKGLFRIEISELLKSQFNIEIDEEKDFLDEIERILTIDIGIIENDLNWSKMQFDDMVKNSQSKDYDFYDRLVGISNILQNNSLVKEDMSLAVYIKLENLKNRLIKEQKHGK